MTDKELSKLSKTQLLEILYFLRKENDELKNENQRLIYNLEKYEKNGIYKEILEAVKENSRKLDVFSAWLLNEDNED
ncbi:MAG: hypothetical protein PUB67_04300 [Clostridiales bacterium]|nr:hypothetical protein [Clostridiales bacterium]